MHRQAPRRRRTRAARRRPRDRARRVLRRCSGPPARARRTTLRILAGLESVSAGRVLMDGEDVTAHGAGRARRRDGVPELRALSAHDGVRRTSRFPLQDGRHRRAARSTRAVADAAAQGRHRSSARPHARPALGRPAAALRARARDRAQAAPVPARRAAVQPRRQAAPRDARSSCKKLQRSLGATTVYVTHDQEEAMTLADRIAVFMDGRIVQVGTPREIFARPQTRRGRRLHRHAADEPAAGDVGRRAVSVDGERAAGRRRPRRAPREVDARRAPGRPAHRRRAACRRASSASRTSATAASSAFVAGDAACSSSRATALPRVQRRRRRASGLRARRGASVRRGNGARLLDAHLTRRTRHDTANAERRPHPQRRHGLLRPRLLRRRDRDAEPRPPRRRTACASRSSTTPRAAARRARRC